MKQYKLIKKLPFEGSPEIGYISTEKVGEAGAHYWNHNWFYPEDFPEYWELVVEKDYEILSFIHDGSFGVPLGYVVNMKNGMLDAKDQFLPESHYLNSSCWKINSVKRLSDGEIFTINDKLDGFDVTAKISLFRIENNQMKVGIRECGIVGLSACKHKPKPRSIFTTEDGKEMFEGDKYYAVYSTWLCDSFNVSKTSPLSHTKNFSSRELADKYIQENKPQYSKLDMIAFCNYAKSYVSGHTTVPKHFDHWIELNNKLKK